MPVLQLRSSAAPGGHMTLGAAMFSSEFDDWNTPDPVLVCVRRIAIIGLDPFGNEQSIVGARREFRLTRGEDALLIDWRGHGLVFCNPPYGRALYACMRRIAHFAALGVEIVTLVPHRTDAAWYQDHAGSVRAKCEWRGRLAHGRGVADRRQLQLMAGAPPPAPAEGEVGAPFPSVVLYHGPRVELFAAAFADAGEIWTR
jgi:hypothetical protein